MKHQRPILATAALAAVAVTSACGGAEPSATPVTVTVTPTVTASAPSSSSSSSSSSKPAAPTSDVKGRAFDYGVVTKVSKVAGVTAIELDRYTWKKLDDAKLAQSGVPDMTFKGAKPPYTNQNATITFTIPVAADARILYHHCVAADEPLQTRSATVQELAKLAAPENTVVVGLDDQGRLKTADNIAACPK